MATVKRKENESIDSMLRRFKRKVNDEMIIADVKKHEIWLTKSQKRREKRKKNQQRLRRAERMNKRYYHGPYED